MSFSLKYLSVLVAIAAIFTVALLTITSLWAFVAINLAVGVLLAATIGLWLGRLNPTFWLAFCVVGWFYLAIAFIPSDSFRLSKYLPSEQITSVVVRHDVASIASSIDRVAINDARVLQPQSKIVIWGDDSQRFEDVLASLTALVLGGLAGIISVLLIRPTPSKSAEH